MNIRVARPDPAYICLPLFLCTMVALSGCSAPPQAAPNTAQPGPSSPVSQSSASSSDSGPATPNITSPITANKQWTPQFRAFTGIDMALVPPGCFQMGTDSPPSSSYDDEKPSTKICFDKAFWIDKTDVTQGQFAQLGGTAAHDPNFKGDKLPMDHISWFESHDFCVKRGGRLPTEAEWEYAARGPDDLIYPWGNTFDPDKVVFSGNSNGQMAAAGSKDAGASWVGALDMSGNVWQWVGSIYKPYPYNAADGREDDSNKTDSRVLRGGSWNDGAEFLRTTTRYRDDPSGRYGRGGFRCVHA